MPTTEAGRALLDDYPARYGGLLYTDPVSRQLTIEAIEAIEAEAAAKATADLRAELAERVRELDNASHEISPGFGPGLLMGWLYSVPTYSHDEAGEDSPYDDMCPNCVTPWKCNGPHEPPARVPSGYLVDRDDVLRIIEAKWARTTAEASSPPSSPRPSPTAACWRLRCTPPRSGTSSRP